MVSWHQGMLSQPREMPHILLRRIKGVQPSRHRGWRYFLLSFPHLLLLTPPKALQKEPPSTLPHAQTQEARGRA